jgi:hypothetical protein
VQLLAAYSFLNDQSAIISPYLHFRQAFDPDINKLIFGCVQNERQPITDYLSISPPCVAFVAAFWNEPRE